MIILMSKIIEADEKYQWKKIPNNHSLKNPTNLLMKFRKRQVN